LHVLRAYTESFKDEKHLAAIIAEAQEIVGAALKG
jgi:phosphoglucomutase